MSPRNTSLREHLHQRVFDGLYARSLLYNACWEDPACDRLALKLGHDDEVLVITSGGCNALDYALCGPRRVWAVDANPRQTALLELKLAGIRSLDYDDFFSIFGEGRHPAFRQLYRDKLRAHLSPIARRWWDDHGHWFAPRDQRSSFYFHGLSGLVARLMRTWFDWRPSLRRAVNDLFAATTLEEQRTIYDTRVEPLLWTGPMRWLLSRQATMSLMGVPCNQTREVERAHSDGIAGFIRAAMAAVFRHLPVWSNYFWSVYIRGSYTRTCCPEYLRDKNFHALKAGLVDRVQPVTDTVTGLLARGTVRPSRFVLLDHMDWMADRRPADLAVEWEHILACAAPKARAIFRSAHADPHWLDPIAVGGAGRGRRLGEILQYDRPLAAVLHRQDRVGTYGGFHIADIAL